MSYSDSEEDGSSHHNHNERELEDPELAALRYDSNIIDYPVHFWNHMTIVLHPARSREIQQREEARAKDVNHPSIKYIEDRSRGFLFIAWFKRTSAEDAERHGDVPPGSVGLFATVDHPHELVVIKRILGHVQHTLRYSADDRSPAEIMFCTVRDPHFTGGHPHGQRLCTNPPIFVQTYAYQVHQNDPPNETKVTIYQKYYNGGTLFEFVELAKKRQRPIPEAFIWHVIAQVGRALSWLHTGDLNLRAFNVQNYPRHRNHAGHQINTRSTADGWDPIVHAGVNLSNIYLHYPTDQERVGDEELQLYGDELPMVVLGDFGLAFRESKARQYSGEGEEDLLCHRSKPDMPERATWRDKALFGCVIKHLVLAANRSVTLSRQHDDALKDFGVIDLSEPNGDHGTGVYSPHLLACVAAFEPLVALLTEHPTLVDLGSFWQRIKTTTQRDWDAWPTNDFVYGTLVSRADFYVDVKQTPREDKSVIEDEFFPLGVAIDREAEAAIFGTPSEPLRDDYKPVESVVPVRSRARWPPLTRPDWNDVWKHLDNIVQTEFADWTYPDHAPYESRPVEIMKVWPEGDPDGDDSDDDYGPSLPEFIPQGDDWPLLRLRRQIEAEKAERARIARAQRSNTNLSDAGEDEEPEYQGDPGDEGLPDYEEFLEYEPLGMS